MLNQFKPLYSTYGQTSPGSIKIFIQQRRFTTLVGLAQDVDDGLEGEPLRDVVAAAEHLAELGAREGLLCLRSHGGTP